MNRKASRLPRRPAVYALTGMAAALLLVVAPLAIGAPLAELTGDAIDRASGDGAISLTHAQLKATIAAETQGRRLAVVVAYWLVFVCQCGIAFWIGLRSAPKWYFGLSPVLVQPLMMLLLPLDIDSDVGRLRHMNFVPFAVLCVLALAVPIALAAWLGGRVGASSEGSTIPVGRVE
jgi:hypothetical protein